ncbi:hypothetical protein J2S14_004158 [Lederbergia wuyishanensis]|uniref:Uncharacterized protein n=1 Tax=Lederbergia wuyishanensis TaxID=1347903 RepID=A0ABU0DA42_9BACI|nr:hypothetical protein [Lederbergia wuyishanensis]
MYEDDPEPSEAAILYTKITSIIGIVFLTILIILH